MSRHWTEDELKRAQEHGKRSPVLLDAPVKAKGRLAARKLNRIELAYAGVLIARPDVIWSAYEGITLRLGNDCRFTPDFAVMLADGSLEMHETKGFMRDDALVKIKVAAASYPFRFVLVTRVKGEWITKEILP